MTSFQRWEGVDYYSSRRIVKYILCNIVWCISIKDYYIAYSYWLQMCILRSMNKM